MFVKDFILNLSIKYQRVFVIIIIQTVDNDYLLDIKSAILNPHTDIYVPIVRFFSSETNIYVLHQI